MKIIVGISFGGGEGTFSRFDLPFLFLPKLVVHSPNRHIIETKMYLFFPEFNKFTFFYTNIHIFCRKLTLLTYRYCNLVINFQCRHQLNQRDNLQNYNNKIVKEYLCIGILRHRVSE